ncbi:MAG: autotransporter outer membrane beta-barrel domain-containing protein, partial [Deltaproteobacteria bacterium]|nr:autotransporter outer membrane beta-barrel domain-containing protein [Deltaproteobacteria bacterium]
FFFGVSGSYSKSEVEFSSFDPFVSEGFALGVYSTAIAGDWFADFYAAYGKQDYDLKRMISTPTSSRLAESSTSADQILAGIRGGYNLDYKGWHLDLSTALRYAWLQIEGYSETGAGIYNLTVRDRDITSIQVEGEIEVNYDIEFSNTVLTPFVYFVGGLELKDELDTLKSHFTASPALTAFSVSTDLDQDWTTKVSASLRFVF